MSPHRLRAPLAVALALAVAPTAAAAAVKAARYKGDTDQNRAVFFTVKKG